MTDMPSAIRHFLNGIETGNWEGFDACVTSDVLYDGTVPGWHYQYEGAERVVQEYQSEWSGWHIITLHTNPTPDGMLVEFEARKHRPGPDQQRPQQWGVRMANIFRFDGDRIAEHRFYCGGEWDESTLHRIDAEAPKVQRNAGDSDVGSDASV
jgi:hypothetical protein